ncbi:hypothetical protein O1611_g4310 [Lasiodiplodia mahajangana]|uniref:Uncharacterized protein n=1 Tax=Lasiodiplodia mahajangana TaxID=1108764 RepID=A0ACC2JQ59_9PEZI|nr:hypothetical protein O1611_g4310 [Lasiodiplodia mahajangana]
MAIIRNNYELRLEAANTHHRSGTSLSTATDGRWFGRASDPDVAGQGCTTSFERGKPQLDSYLPSWSSSAWHHSHSRGKPGSEPMVIAPEIAMSQMLSENFNVLSNVSESFLVSDSHTPFAGNPAAMAMMDQQAYYNTTGLASMATHYSGQIQPARPGVLMRELVPLNFSGMETSYNHHTEMLASGQLYENQLPLASRPNTASEPWVHGPPFERISKFVDSSVLRHDLVGDHASESGEYGSDASCGHGQARMGTNNGLSALVLGLGQRTPRLENYSDAITAIVISKQVLVGTSIVTWI